MGIPRGDIHFECFENTSACENRHFAGEYAKDFTEPFVWNWMKAEIPTWHSNADLLDGTFGHCWSQFEHSYHLVFWAISDVPGVNPDSIEPCYFFLEIFGDILFPTDKMSNNINYLVEFLAVIAETIELNFDSFYFFALFESISEIPDKVSFHLTLSFLLSLFEVTVAWTFEGYLIDFFFIDFVVHASDIFSKFFVRGVLEELCIFDDLFDAVILHKKYGYYYGRGKLNQIE